MAMPALKICWLKGGGSRGRRSWMRDRGGRRTDVKYSPGDGGRLLCFMTMFDLNVLLVVHSPEPLSSF